MITTIGNDRTKFVEGQEYWTFYMETTNKGNALRNVVKVFKTKLLKKRKSSWESTGFYLEFSIPSGLSRTMNHNLPIYMNGYGLAQLEYYDTEEEAIKGFDKKVEYYASGEKAADRDKMFKHKYHQSEPKMSSIEKLAKDWRKGLTKEEESYLSWFIRNS
jgi:hypothetical protein